MNVLTKKGRRIRSLEIHMQSARSYEEWRGLAEELDRENGLDHWRAIDDCALYDARVLRKRHLDYFP